MWIFYTRNLVFLNLSRNNSWLIENLIIKMMIVKLLILILIFFRAYSSQIYKTKGPKTNRVREFQSVWYPHVPKVWNWSPIVCIRVSTPLQKHHSPLSCQTPLKSQIFLWTTKILKFFTLHPILSCKSN